MIEFLGEWITAVAMILCESGPYLLIGFVIAGLIKVWIPEEQIYRYLGKDDFGSVATASFAGVPIPLCSCSVLPAAAALKKSGAGKGATTSFLISTPETGVDSIGVTWALMDPLMTVARPFAALFTALGAGSAVNVLVRRGWDAKAAPALSLESADAQDHCSDEHCHHSHERSAISKGPLGTLRAAIDYGFGSLLDDLTPWFIFGFIVSGLIAALVPDNFFGELLPSGWISMLTMLVVGIPLYICATASTPVAAALVAKGLDPGAALVFLLAGPATNLATMSVVSGFLGRRVLAIYLLSIILFALLLGWLVNGLYGALAIDPVTAVSLVPEESFGPVSVIAGIILVLLLARSARRLNLLSRTADLLRR